MSFTDLFIKRPVFATVVSLGLLLIGMISYSRLTVREYPNIDTPVVNVETFYRGAAAPIVETQVTKVLEDSLAGIEGIDFMTSTSKESSSQITVVFSLERDAGDAAADVRDRVSRVRGALPDVVEEPVIQKVEADAQPIIYIAFSSDRHTELDLTDYADRYVKDQLQNLTGVATVHLFGDRRYAMRLWLDPLKLAAYDLTVQDVETALRAQNVEIPAGSIKSQDREFSVLSETDLRTEAEFEAIVLRRTPGYLVRIADVGRAEVAAESEDSIARYNGDSAVALGVVKQSTANPLDVSAAVAERLASLENELPPGMTIKVAYDSSKFIRKSIENVYETIGIAIVLVMLIIFFFLRSPRATVIPMVTIPVSLLGACFLMYLMGFSINTLTLLAMVLAIGLVVDDAIVVLENIFRHIEEGMKPQEAALKGAREIVFAILGMTLTLAAVYAPVGFLSGATGKLFREFAFSLAGAVLISGFVALTLTPMMCGLLLRHSEKHGAVYRGIDTILTGLTSGYRRLLGLALRARFVVILGGIALAGLGAFLFTRIPSELAPYEDQGAVVGFFIGPEGATTHYMDRYVRQIEGIYQNAADTSDVMSYFTVIGFPLKAGGISFVLLKPWEDRDTTQSDIMGMMGGPMFMVPGIMAFPIAIAPLGQNIGQGPLQLVIETSEDYDALQGMVNQVMAKITAEGSPLINVQSDLKLNLPQIRIEPDRDKVASLGLDLAEVGHTLEVLLGGGQVTRFKRGGEQYDVILQVGDENRQTPADLDKISVRLPDGSTTQLSNIVTRTEGVAPQSLNHFDQLRSATITANLAPGVPLAAAIEFADAAAREVLPGSARIDHAGESREYLKSRTSLMGVFLGALAFIFLVLSAQFESFRSPLVILFSVPLSLAGGLIALFLFNNTLNIYSEVGLITLIGLITKHGILIVDFANRERIEKGVSRAEAAMSAAVLRLRPILMTTGAMVLGSLPLVIAHGAGAESRRSIGIVIVGGLLVGTFFTLFVVPAVYTLLAGKVIGEEKTA
jgi:multidrug efflux pump